MLRSFSALLAALFALAFISLAAANSYSSRPLAAEQKVPATAPSDPPPRDTGPFADEINRQGEAASVPVLMYHHFVLEGEENSTTIEATRFQQQMQWLYDNGFSTATVTELKQFLQGELALPQKVVVITIDDGYASTYYIAYPILAQYGFHGTVFVIGHSRGRTPRSYPHFSWRQGREMQASGVMGIHSHTHNLHYIEDGLPALAAADDDTIMLDLLTSRTQIMDETGNNAFAFAYPYGYGPTDERVKQLVAAAGFKLAFTTKPGRVTAQSDPLALPRYTVDHETELADFIRLVEGEEPVL